MTKKQKIEVIIPEGATSSLGLKLVALTKAICEKTGESGGFGLGGEYGYGAEYENGVFMMKPFCWCEEDDCKWCSGIKPNFLYKPTGAEIFWYKWIGRSQEQRGKLPKDWLEKCIKSLK